ncbi:MAG: hypothetical protein P4L99_10180 [Chthoniobacter sp.]|nr:hypothetical protein [Chthoniobacter sp.]
MNIRFSCGRSTWRLEILLAAFIRLKVQPRSATQRQSFDPLRTRPTEQDATQQTRPAAGGSVAGVPRRILLSEHFGPGGPLKDTLMVRPSAQDDP